ncbi:MAG: hypothetical protein ACYS8Y_06390 [Planctomycetota bacterium]|jgi:hypothetical protein
MSEPGSFKRSKDKINPFVFILFCIVFSIILILLYISGSAPVKKGELADSDCYMHLIRASDLYNTGRWYEPVLIKSNAPYGEKLHWSRPFDVLLLLGAAPIALLVNFKSALFWWGVVISPILLCITLFALYWSTRPILSKEGPLLIVFVFVPQLVMLNYFQAGRPDHHSLLMFIFILSVGFTLRIILKPIKILFCYMAGAISALSIWVSVESMVPTCIILVALGLLWILENGDFSSKSLHYSLALFIVTGLCMVLERPWYDLATEELDRLSVVYWSVLGFISLFWITVSILNYYTSLFRRWANRFLFSVAGVAIVALTIWLLFPKLYSGPFADVDHRILPMLFNKILEVQPLLSKSVSLGLSVQVIGTSIVCFPFLFYMLLRGAEVTNRKGWIYITLSLVVFILISLYQLRWSAYAQALLSIIITEILSRVLIWRKRQKGVLWKVLRESLVILIFSTFFLITGLLADKIGKKGESTRSRQTVSLIRLCEHLSESEGWRGRNLRILTNPVFGAEILYRTQHEVIGTVNRYGPGILDTYDIMTADTDEKALELMQKRQIGIIIICPTSRESVFYSKPEQTSTFYQRLRQNMVPHWLRKVELPRDLSSLFLLFEIVQQ